MKRIALFGGSGRSGQHFMSKALAAGYAIRALARNPEKIPQQGPRLTVVAGDVLDPEAVRVVVQDTDVVVSLFGHVKGSPAWLQTAGTKHILQAMQAEGVGKIISLSGGGLPFEKDRPKLADKLIRGLMKLAAPKVLNDAVRHAEVLKASDRDWIIVRGPRLTDGPERGDYQVGWVGVPGGTTIRRADLADFLLRQVDDDTYLRQMPFVSY